MVINIVWLILMGLGTLVAMGTGKISLVGKVIFESAGQAVNFTIGLAGIIAFWSGILKVAEASGITADVARWFQPLLSRLFPGIPRGHKALGLISMTIAANFLGLGNIATPFGLKTMTELKQLNPDQDSASDAICTFMALVFGGICLIPTTLMAIRSRAGSANPAAVIGPIFLITLAGTGLELIINHVAIRFSKRLTPVLRPHHPNRSHTRMTKAQSPPKG